MGRIRSSAYANGFTGLADLNVEVELEDGHHPDPKSEPDPNPEPDLDPNPEPDLDPAPEPNPKPTYCSQKQLRSPACMGCIQDPLREEGGFRIRYRIRYRVRVRVKVKVKVRVRIRIRVKV
jgi:hypothetical protein